jgi:hypothetical protein
MSRTTATVLICCAMLVFAGYLLTIGKGTETAVAAGAGAMLVVREFMSKATERVLRRQRREAQQKYEKEAETTAVLRRKLVQRGPNTDPS